MSVGLSHSVSSFSFSVLDLTFLTSSLFLANEKQVVRDKLADLKTGIAKKKHWELVIHRNIYDDPNLFV